jgi:hypothetical protein
LPWCVAGRVTLTVPLDGFGPRALVD